MKTTQQMKDQVLFIETYLPRCTYGGLIDDYEEVNKFINAHLGTALIRQQEDNNKAHFTMKFGR